MQQYSQEQGAGSLATTSKEELLAQMEVCEKNLAAASWANDWDKVYNAVVDELADPKVWL